MIASAACGRRTGFQLSGAGEGAGNGVFENGSKGKFMKVAQYLKNFAREEDGVTAIEYGLLASLIALAIIAGATALGGKLNDMFNFIAGKLKTS